MVVVDDIESKTQTPALINVLFKHLMLTELK